MLLAACASRRSLKLPVSTYCASGWWGYICFPRFSSSSSCRYSNRNWLQQWASVLSSSQQVRTNTGLGCWISAEGRLLMTIWSNCNGFFDKSFRIKCKLEIDVCYSWDFSLDLLERNSWTVCYEKSKRMELILPFRSVGFNYSLSNFFFFLSLQLWSLLILF